MNRLRTLSLIACLTGTAAACDLGSPVEPRSDGAADELLAQAAVVRTVVCHLDRDLGRYERLVVASPAVRAHLRHGDGRPGDEVPNSAGAVFDQDCGTSTVIDFETFPDGSPTCDFCVVQSQYEPRGVIFEPFAYILDVTAYEASGVPTNRAVAIGTRGASKTFSILLVRQPGLVQFDVVSNDAAPPLNVLALDSQGTELTVSREATTYVTRFGFLFRRERLTVTSASGVASLAIDESANTRFGYHIDDLRLSY